MQTADVKADEEEKKHFVLSKTLTDMRARFSL
jgi:hypothetical protein